MNQPTAQPKNTKKRGLGRGLEALLGPKASDVIRAVTQEPTQHGQTVHMIAIECLQPGRYQPRSSIDDVRLLELAESIKSQGILQPIILRPLGSARFEIIAGERRWRAAQHAGLSQVPALIHECDDKSAMAVALIENIQREDLNALEEAQALQKLINECQITHAQAAQIVGRSRAAVSNLLRLLELPESVSTLVRSKQLEMGHARALLPLRPECASKLAKEAVDKQWSVREVEHRAHQLQLGRIPDTRPASKPKRTDKHADIAALEKQLSESLGTQVVITHRANGKGHVVIHYNDLESLDGVLERLTTQA